jgi:glycosyltransferase involved in cell wall biosynthesis
MPPEVSIICPTYNRSALLRECVESILSKGDRFEVIIADDGSTDETTTICDQLRQTFGSDRIIVSRSESSLGAPKARNRGLEIASADLIVFVDSDDVVVPSGIEVLQERINRDPSLDFVYGRVIRTDERLRPLGKNISVGQPFSDAPVDVAGYHWHTMGALYRRNYSNKVGPWNKQLTGSQDWEYQARVKLAGGHGEFVDTLVGYWRQHAHERVGPRSFRYDYVRSVITACASILHLARETGHCDSALERKLAKKLIAHALELGANGYPRERFECLSHAASALRHSAGLRAAVKYLRFAPAFADRWLWQLFVAHRVA